MISYVYRTRLPLSPRLSTLHAARFFSIRLHTSALVPACAREEGTAYFKVTIAAATIFPLNSARAFPPVGRERSLLRDTESLSCVPGDTVLLVKDRSSSPPPTTGRPVDHGKIAAEPRIARATIILRVAKIASVGKAAASVIGRFA